MWSVPLFCSTMASLVVFSRGKLVVTWPAQAQQYFKWFPIRANQRCKWCNYTQALWRRRAQMRGRVDLISEDVRPAAAPVSIVVIFFTSLSLWLQCIHFASSLRYDFSRLLNDTAAPESPFKFPQGTKLFGLLWIFYLFFSVEMLWYCP